MKKIFLILILLAMKTNANSQSIQYSDAYSVYITERIKESRDFYVKWLDFEVVFEATWFVYLQSQGERPVSFALIDVDHPSTPPSYGSFNKRGSFFTLQVENAKSTYDALVKRGAPITYALKKEEWGQLRFGLTDPNGLYIDIVEQVEPSPGYWEKYLVRD